MSLLGKGLPGVPSCVALVRTFPGLRIALRPHSKLWALHTRKALVPSQEPHLPDVVHPRDLPEALPPGTTSERAGSTLSVHHRRNTASKRARGEQSL